MSFLHSYLQETADRWAAGKVRCVADKEAEAEAEATEEKEEAIKGSFPTGEEELLDDSEQRREAWRNNDSEWKMEAHMKLRPNGMEELEEEYWENFLFFYFPIYWKPILDRNGWISTEKFLKVPS